MVQVSRSIYELGVCEAQEEKGDALSVAESYGDADAERTNSGEKQVHAPAWQGTYPSKAGVCEVKSRIDVQVVNPAVREESNDCDERDASERDTECSDRGSRYGFWSSSDDTVRNHSSNDRASNPPLGVMSSAHGSV